MLRIKNKNQGEGGYWTGWFMGDGDYVGKHLKGLKTSEEVQNFSRALRAWGRQFQENFKLGRVVYAGGDDFLGVMFGTEKEPKRDGQEALDFLIELQNRWQSGQLGINLSVGFIWAGHSVPQRDVLQHCREAEKYSKSLEGKNCVTIRILFNNGQFVQWRTPWKYVEWLKDYCDRSSPTRKAGKDANWSHVYSDFAQLKARHAIPPKTAPKTNNPNEDIVALSLLGFYFGEDKKKILSRERKTITGSEGTKSVIDWIDNMIQVGWQLCSNS